MVEQNLRSVKLTALCVGCAVFWAQEAKQGWTSRDDVHRTPFEPLLGHNWAFVCSGVRPHHTAFVIRDDVILRSHCSLILRSHPPVPYSVSILWPLTLFPYSCSLLYSLILFPYSGPLPSWDSLLDPSLIIWLYAFWVSVLLLYSCSILWSFGPCTLALRLGFVLRSHALTHQIIVLQHMIPEIKLLRILWICIGRVA